MNWTAGHAGYSGGTELIACLQRRKALVLSSVRRVVISLLLLLFATHALVPALITYVCTGMSGRHFLQPCCPAESAQPEEATSQPTLSPGHCCDPHAPVVIDAKQPSWDDTQHVLRAPLAVAVSFVSLAATPPLPPLLLVSRARGSPFGLASGPPQPQRQILRV
jgi:hypothetical protein